MYVIAFIVALIVLAFGLIAYGCYIFIQKKHKPVNTPSTPKIIMVDEKTPSESNRIIVRSDSVSGTPIVIYFLY